MKAYNKICSDLDLSPAIKEIDDNYSLFGEFSRPTDLPDSARMRQLRVVLHFRS